MKYIFVGMLLFGFFFCMHAAFTSYGEHLASVKARQMYEQKRKDEKEQRRERKKDAFAVFRECVATGERPRDCYEGWRYE